MNILKRSLLLSLLFGAVSVFHAKTEPQMIDYTTNLNVQEFIKQLAKEDGFNAEALNQLFIQVDIQEKALKYYAIAKKKPKSKSTGDKKKSTTTKKKPKSYHGSWSRYEKKLLNEKRVIGGITFMNEHKETLSKAEKLYGVPPEYVTAIIGIESYYGRYTGNYPVFDTLATLAFEKNRRNKFFKKELREYLKMTRREMLDPREIHGSFAGAIGLGQFMPSNFETLGVDFDKDGKVRISQPVDAIGSIANYFKQSGWKTDVPVATRVKYEGIRFTRLKTGYLHKYHRKNLKGIYPREKFDYNDPVRLIKLNREKYDELWYGTKNFYVITRYNHSSYYAMAVHQLAQKIKSSTLVVQNTQKPELIAMVKQAK